MTNMPSRMTNSLRIGPGWFPVQCSQGLHATPSNFFFFLILISARLPRGPDKYQTTHASLGSTSSSCYSSSLSNWPSLSHDGQTSTGRRRSGTATDTTWMPRAVVPARNGPGLTHGGGTGGEACSSAPAVGGPRIRSAFFHACSSVAAT